VNAASIWRVPPAAFARDATLAGLERTVGATLDAVLGSPRTERLVDRLLAQPGMEHLIDRVLRSELAVRTVDRILDSEEMERIVSHIAESPEVREAITAQTAGLAGDLGDEVRARVVTGDAFAERIAHRLIGRRTASTDVGRSESPGA
jgi:hypothetical protein